MKNIKTIRNGKELYDIIRSAADPCTIEVSSYQKLCRALPRFFFSTNLMLGKKAFSLAEGV